MMNPSTVPQLTDDELLQLMPPGGDQQIFALDRERWLTYRAVLELTAARGRLELAKRLLGQAKVALQGTSEVERLVMVQRIAEALANL